MDLLDTPSLAALSTADRLTHLKQYIKSERDRVEALHEADVEGKIVCAELSKSFDRLLCALYDLAVAECPEMEKVALVANGGYGRGGLHPGSDLDLLFLTPKSASSLSEPLKAAIDIVLYPLWDLNLKVGHAVRNIAENIAEGKQDSITRTTLLDSRLIAGNEKLFLNFKTKYRKEAIEACKVEFIAERTADIQARHDKFSGTIYLQEPNVKESPGGLRDWHNLLWIIDTARGSRDILSLQDEGVLTETATEQVLESVDFLIRLRTEMHFRTGKAVDVLSLRLQGEVAQGFNYPGDDILIQIEGLMKDYYTHARNLHNRVKGMLEHLDIELEAFKDQAFSWLPWMGTKRAQERQVDGFLVSSDGFLYAENDDIFTEDPIRLLRAFRHCQHYRVRPAPTLRKRIKDNLDLVDDGYRRTPRNHEIMETIMGTRGLVGGTLRAMHRVGLIGQYFPEFGRLDCLVQHEFFHRYTADEHTLRTIDMLDRISGTTHPEDKLFGDLFNKMEDPYALYLALLLHDTGRADNSDDHVDGSSQNVIEVGKRLNITGERYRLISFLVEHHLTLFQVGTKMDIDDPEVINEFCEQMVTVDRLDTLLVFTYCDSLGTNPDGWNGWKELAIITLYKRAHATLNRSQEEEITYQQEIMREQKETLLANLDPKYYPALESHFREMPLAYFRYRDWQSIRAHIRSIWQYENRRARRPDTPFEAAIQWVERKNLGYSEFSVLTTDKRNLLASICCALASHDISILSANVHTRSDGLALDIFRVCNDDEEAVTDDILQMQVVTTIYKLNESKSYDPNSYIREKRGYLDEQPAIEYAPEVNIENREGDNYTTIEVQATDRIGLLHDLLKLFHEKNLQTKGARIVTERKTALDSFRIVMDDGQPLDEQTCDDLLKRIAEVA